MEKSVFQITTACILMVIMAAGFARAMPSGAHALLAYEAAFLHGVPSEIRAYVGDPQDSLERYSATICRGAYDEDSDRDPGVGSVDIFTLYGLLNWGSHFWNPEGGPAGGRLDYAGDIPVNLERKNAYQRAAELYAQARSLYAENPAAAYYRLGKVAHLIADMATPAHVNLDVHLNDGTQFGDDSFEHYLDALWMALQGGGLSYNSEALVSSLSPVDYADLPDGEYAGETALFRIFLSVATLAGSYDSDDASGGMDNGARRGMSVQVAPGALNTLHSVWGLRSGYPDEPLSDGYRLALFRDKFILLTSTLNALRAADPPYEAVRIEWADGSETYDLSEFTYSDIGDQDAADLAAILIPAAIAHTAALYVLFWSETHSALNADAPEAALSRGARVVHVARPDPLELTIDVDPQGWRAVETEVYAWLETWRNGEETKYFYDGQWTSFNLYSEMRPAACALSLGDVNGLSWRILDDTALLPEESLSVKLCIDRTSDLIYTPSESVCTGIWITVGN